MVDLDDRLALSAGELSVATRMALANSIMLATAPAHGAAFWTQDAAFEGGVRLKRKT